MKARNRRDAYRIRGLPSCTLVFLQLTVACANLGNYTRESGIPPSTLARRHDSWSNLRRWLLRLFPLHVMIFYILVAAASGLCLARQGCAHSWPLCAMTAALTAAGLIEFPASVLLDAAETGRHLFLFHVITELLIVCTFAALLCRPGGYITPRERKQAVPATHARTVGVV